MQLLQKRAGQVIKVAQIRNKNGESIFAPRLVDVIASKFLFLSHPKEVDDFDYEKGLLFRHGAASDGSLIDVLNVFEDGVVVENSGDTSSCEAFLVELVDLLDAELGANVVQFSGAPTSYVSQVECVLDLRECETVRKFAAFGEVVSECLRGYGEPIAQPLQFYGAQWRLGRGRPTPAFRLELSERQGAPDGALFSVAALRTSDHLAALEALERIFR